MIGQGILLSNEGSVTLEAYSDADFAGSVIDSISTTRYCEFIRGSLVTWRRKKIKVVSLSSAKAKHGVIVHGIKEAKWIQGILE